MKAEHVEEHMEKENINTEINSLHNNKYILQMAVNVDKKILNKIQNKMI